METKRQTIVTAVTAFVAMTFLSQSSPLYPLNIWCDANCFLTVGKSMLHGLVPYRDLLEQKGPLLYMLHALAALVSETSFLGVYFLEIIACAFFLVYSYKIIKLFRPAAGISLIPILAAVVYSSIGFQSGDSAEELCLPLIAFAVYVALKAIKRNELPTKGKCFVIGVTSACVLWIKYTMLGFYMGWFLTMVIVFRTGKEDKTLCEDESRMKNDVAGVYGMLLVILSGVLVVTVPILVYFGANGALDDLWTVYFYDNLFLYSSMSGHFIVISMIRNLWYGIENIWDNFLFPACFIGIGAIALVMKKDKKEFLSYALMFGFTFLSVYVGGRNYAYYSFIFSVFVPVGIAAVSEVLENCREKYWKHSFSKNGCKYYFISACLVSFVFAYSRCPNTYFISYDKSDLAQYQFAEIISQVEDATLLNYGFLDGGFYTTTGIVPNCKAFHKLNLELSEIMELQEEFVQEGKVNFVITCNEELESDAYICVAKAATAYRSGEMEYYLYQLTESIR